MSPAPDNPFRTCAGVLRDLHRRCMAEYMSPAVFLTGCLPAPEVGEFLGAIGGLVNDCESAARILDGLDQPDLDAFRRALSRLG